MKPQFAWHVHHDRLVESLTESIAARRVYIRNNKAHAEVPIRLRLLQKVRRALPVAVVEAGKVYVEAEKTYAEAGKACAHEIQALHAVECPNCPWNGETIFP